MVICIVLVSLKLFSSKLLVQADNRVAKEQGPSKLESWHWSWKQQKTSSLTVQQRLCTDPPAVTRQRSAFGRTTAVTNAVQGGEVQLT